MSLLLAVAGASAPVVTSARRGDDAKRIVHSRLAAPKRWQDDLFEANIASVEKWARSLPDRQERKAPPRVDEAVSDLADALEMAMPPIEAGDVMGKINGLLARPAPDYSAIAAAMLVAAQEARQARRKRRNRHLMLLMM